MKPRESAELLAWLVFFAILGSLLREETRVHVVTVPAPITQAVPAEALLFTDEGFEYRTLISWQPPERSTAAKNAFKRVHPCPANGNPRGPCPGYVVDHIKPLACGGADAPHNMQWQTVEDAKRKDRIELQGEGCPVRFRKKTEQIKRLFRKGDK